MHTLTGLDASFLYLETPEMPMHVGSFNLCELPAGFKGSFHKAVQKHVRQRLHLAPVFTRKLMLMPLNLGHPAWIDAPAVDIDFHVRRADKARKGARAMTLAEAHQRCAQLHSELLDRRFALWEFHVFDRIALPDGRIVAGVLSKIHHAALDGKGAVLLAHATLDTSPLPRKVPPPDPAHRHPTDSEADLGTRTLIASVLATSLGQFSRLAKALPSSLRAIGSTLIEQSAADPSTGQRNRMPMKLAPHTPFNIGIGTERVFAAATLPLQECKALGKAAGGSLNDMLLWICATALRDYLSHHFSLPHKSLVAAMPVSLRNDAADSGDAGNQVGMTLVELGTQIANPRQRMKAIIASTAKVKSSMQSLKGVLPTDYPSLLAPWLVGGIGKQALNAYGKSGLARHLPVVTNLAISNVPGSPVPLYLAGARVLGFHPLSIITHGVALNITIQTYDEKIDFGMVADSQALPHADDLARAIEAAFTQAQSLMGEAAASEKAMPAAPTPAAKAKPRTRKPASPKAPASVRLESSPSSKRRQRPDTGRVSTEKK
ncbi:diacylglycerol O-acyltransferase [Polaromonas sp. CG_9.5]|uniref:wax ester/triacylglycerol synthase family O-acyltransferase n=1 Tax=Polaromonas sp. CG_9.5 TaxID=3071705 RepID=UPI002E03A971|nr:diacylglycerol O-acyltransferase [Polaromonas sp. CG_9.5]